MQKGDRVKFRETAITISLGIAGGPGVVEDVDGDTVVAIYTDTLFGPAGPFVLSEEDVIDVGAE